MFELYEYDGFGETLYMTFDSREDMVAYMEYNELYAEYEEGFFGRCPDGDEITL